MNHWVPSQAKMNASAGGDGQTPNFQKTIHTRGPTKGKKIHFKGTTMNEKIEREISREIGKPFQMVKASNLYELQNIIHENLSITYFIVFLGYLLQIVLRNLEEKFLMY